MAPQRHDAKGTFSQVTHVLQRRNVQVQSWRGIVRKQLLARHDAKGTFSRSRTQSSAGMFKSRAG